MSITRQTFGIAEMTLNSRESLETRHRAKKQTKSKLYTDTNHDFDCYDGYVMLIST